MGGIMKTRSITLCLALLAAWLPLAAADHAKDFEAFPPPPPPPQLGLPDIKGAKLVRLTFYGYTLPQLLLHPSPRLAAPGAPRRLGRLRRQRLLPPEG